jgi:hypothetical protein
MAMKTTLKILFYVTLYLRREGSSGVSRLRSGLSLKRGLLLDETMQLS